MGSVSGGRWFVESVFAARFESVDWRIVQVHGNRGKGKGIVLSCLSCHLVLGTLIEVGVGVR